MTAVVPSNASLLSPEQFIGLQADAHDIALNGCLSARFLGHFSPVSSFLLWELGLTRMLLPHRTRLH